MCIYTYVYIFSFLRLQALAGLDDKKPNRGGVLAWCNKCADPKLIEVLAILRFLCQLRPGCQVQQLPVLLKLLEWCDRFPEELEITMELLWFLNIYREIYMYIYI